MHYKLVVAYKFVCVNGVKKHCIVCILLIISKNMCLQKTGTDNANTKSIV